MPNSLRQFFLAAATVAALTMTGCAFAQTPSEQTASVKREVLVNRDDHSYSETDFRLHDHQQLKEARPSRFGVEILPAVVCWRGGSAPSEGLEPMLSCAVPRLPLSKKPRVKRG